MNSDKIQNYITAISTLAKCTALFYKEMIRYGVPQDVAEKAIMIYIDKALIPHQKEDQNNEG